MFIITQRQWEEREAWLYSMLRDIKRNLEKIMAELDDLKAQVAANKTVVQSALTLINGIADRITAAGTDKQALADLASSLKTDDDALAAAVTANTPATG